VVALRGKAIVARNSVRAALAAGDRQRLAVKTGGAVMVRSLMT